MREFEDNQREYSEDEAIFDPETIERERRAAEEEQMRRRIRREIIRVNQGEHDDEIAEERERMAEEERERQEREAREKERERKQQRSIVRNLATGNFLTSDGAQQYYRYMIAIAAMCFFSIFLTFMSLNADRECRILEERASVLRERSVLIEEQRYGISSKHEVKRMLRERNMELIDLRNNSRLIEKK